MARTVGKAVPELGQELGEVQQSGAAAWHDALLDGRECCVLCVLDTQLPVLQLNFRGSSNLCSTDYVIHYYCYYYTPVQATLGLGASQQQRFHDSLPTRPICHTLN